MLLKVPCKFLKFHWREICQGSGVSSILIGRSNQINPLPKLARRAWEHMGTTVRSWRTQSRILLMLFLFLCVFVCRVTSQGCSDKCYREAVRLTRALYPELTGRGVMLDFLSRPYLDSDSFPTTFDLAVSETPHSPPTPGTHEASDADRVGHLGLRFQFDARNHHLVSMFASGSLAATERQNALNKLVEGHPEWTEAQMTDAALSSGAIFGPNRKEEILAKFPKTELEPILGKISIVSAEFDFRGNREPPFYPVMRWTVFFRAESKGRTDGYFAWIEPFSGRVVCLGGR